MRKSDAGDGREMPGLTEGVPATCESICAYVMPPWWIQVKTVSVMCVMCVMCVICVMCVMCDVRAPHSSVINSDSCLS